MNPDALLDQLEAVLTTAQTTTEKSRELSLVVTKIEEAIQWRETDLRKKGEGG